MEIYSRTRTLYLFWLINVRIQRELEECLASFYVTPGQYVAMSHLRGRHRYSAAELARKTGVSAQSTNEVVMALEKLGMITREVDERNVRIRRMSLTVKGLDMLAKIDERVDVLENELFSVITPTEATIMRSSIIALLSSLASRKP